MASVSKKQKSEFPKNWNINNYCTNYESDEHWQLRKKFMEVHKDKFPEERLVCLAQTFINIEFLGCKYPTETMRLVAELSKEVAKEFRESRSTRLKRTFVGAAQAAEQRVKGRRSAQQQTMVTRDISTNSKKANNRISFDTTPTPVKRTLLKNFFSDLPYGNFVLHLIGGRSCLNLSAQRAKVKYEERIKDRKVDIYLDNKFIASADEANIKTSKAEAFNRALKVLQEACYAIKPNPLQDTIKIDKKGSQMVCGVVKAPVDDACGTKLDKSNKGFKMMKMMGWTGGGLGSTNKGREDPVNYLLKNNRLGLGTSDTLNKQYFREVLTNYINSEDIRQLQFESTFTKDERACLHEIAASLSLKSVARGSGNDRFITISKKNIPSEKILTEVLINKNPSYCDKYFVQVPQIKAHEYPEHTQHLDLD